MGFEELAGNKNDKGEGLFSHSEKSLLVDIYKRIHLNKSRFFFF